MKKYIPLTFILTFLFTACNQAPLIKEPNQIVKNDACQLLPKAGPCRAAFPAYYYDDKKQSCQQFIWGGCQGIVPFKKLTDCQTQCMSN